MARWLATDVTGEPFGEVIEEPDRRQALDRATALHGQRCFGVVSWLSWQETLRRRESDVRKRRRSGDVLD